MDGGSRRCRVCAGNKVGSDHCTGYCPDEGFWLPDSNVASVLVTWSRVWDALVLDEGEKHGFCLKMDDTYVGLRIVGASHCER
jgi:hypothetical protein